MGKPGAKAKMPISDPGNKPLAPRAPAATRPGWATPNARGFTVVELLIVIAIIAIGAAAVALALPNADANKLEEEAARLSALIEMARAEARTAGVAVRWVPRADNDADARAAAANSNVAHFLFVGLPVSQNLPSRWLDTRTQAAVSGAAFLVLGPDAILPPQRLVMRLDEHRLELVSDGLGPFVVSTAASASSSVPAIALSSR
jgi:general secretion pathway protein H